MPEKILFNKVDYDDIYLISRRDLFTRIYIHMHLKTEDSEVNWLYYDEPNATQ